MTYFGMGISFLEQRLIEYSHLAVQWVVGLCHSLTAYPRVRFKGADLFLLTFSDLFLIGKPTPKPEAYPSPRGDMKR